MFVYFTEGQSKHAPFYNGVTFYVRFENDACYLLQQLHLNALALMGPRC
jgi:hypothetical protein